MKALVVPTKSEVDALAADVDASMGFPVYGVDIGGGVHADREQSKTLRYSEPLPTKDGGWAYPFEPTEEQEVLALAKGTFTVADDVKDVAVPVTGGKP